jgi:hypothetical protein
MIQAMVIHPFFSPSVQLQTERANRIIGGRPVPIRATSRLSRQADRFASKCASHWLLACPHSSRLFCAHSVATGTNGRQILAQTYAGLCRLRTRVPGALIRGRRQAAFDHAMSGRESENE